MGALSNPLFASAFEIGSGQEWSLMTMYPIHIILTESGSNTYIILHFDYINKGNHAARFGNNLIKLLKAWRLGAFNAHVRLPAILNHPCGKMTRYFRMSYRRIGQQIFAVRTQEQRSSI